MTASNTRAMATSLAPRLLAWRRHLHAHPELSGRESATADYIASELRGLGYQPRTGVGGHGVVADLRVDGARPAVALRADTDALPIHEDTGLPFSSRSPGVMHACGHDAHTAMLLGAAAILKERQTELKSSVRLIFQPHEEVFPGGAPAMIEQGALDGVGSIFGIHISPTLPTNQVGTRAGAFMAAVNPFRIRVIGRGGHAAMPHQCVDPIVAASNVVLALQTVVSRSIALTDSAVVSVTMFHAGTADNIIPNEVTMEGTIRTFDAAIRTTVARRVREIAAAVAAAHGATAEVDIQGGYPVLVNDAEQVDRAAAVVRSLASADSFVTLAPLGGGEDFAYYGEKVPSVFVFLGAGDGTPECAYPHHHPRFRIDEAALPLGAALHAQFALAAGR